MEYEYKISPCQNYNNRWVYKVQLIRDGRTVRERQSDTLFGAKRLVRKMAKAQKKLDKMREVSVQGKVTV